MPVSYPAVEIRLNGILDNICLFHKGYYDLSISSGAQKLSCFCSIGQVSSAHYDPASCTCFSSASYISETKHRCLIGC